MATYLLENSSLDAHVDLDSSVTIGANVGDYFEFSGYANSGNPSNEYRILSFTFGNSEFLILRTGDIWVRANNTLMEFSTGYTQPAVGVDFVVKIVRDTATTFECFLDGVSLGSLTSVNNITTNQFLTLANRSTEGFQGGAYYIEICDDGTGVATNKWLNTTGTGSVWIDQVSANSATQVGAWPGDDSEWVSYSDGPSITASNPTDGVQSTITTSGLTTATSATLGGVALTLGGTIPNLTYTIDVASIGSEQSVPRIGETVELAVTGAEGTATTSVTIQPAVGQAIVTLTSTNKGAGQLLTHMDSTLGKTTAIGDQLYHDDVASINAAGELLTDAKTFNIVLIQDGSATTPAVGTPDVVNTDAIPSVPGNGIPVAIPVTTAARRLARTPVAKVTKSPISDIQY